MVMAIDGTMDRLRWRGAWLVLASAAAFSTAGFFTRWIALDVWTMLFWRGLFAGVFLAGCIAWHHRGGTLAAVRAIGWSGLLAAACSTAATICFIHALRLTTVADVMIIGATTPFTAAALAWLCLGQRERRATMLLSLAALLGVALMVGTGGRGGWRGDLLAVGMTLLISGMMVIIRARRDADLLPASCLSALLCALVVLPVANPLAVGVADLIRLALFGMLQFGLGLLLMTLGTRWISATRSGLISGIEVPLAMLWVWLGFGERPAAMTCLGGIIVMAAVFADLWLGRRAG